MAEKAREKVGRTMGKRTGRHHGRQAKKKLNGGVNPKKVTCRIQPIRLVQTAHAFPSSQTCRAAGVQTRCTSYVLLREINAKHGMNDRNTTSKESMNVFAKVTIIMCTHAISPLGSHSTKPRSATTPFIETRLMSARAEGEMDPASADVSIPCCNCATTLAGTPTRNVQIRK